MATRSSTKCPWRKFYKHITKYMNILHTEACKPQEKIAKLVYAVTYHFASPTMDLEKDEKSTKQLQESKEHLQGSKESTKQSKRVVQESNKRTRRTSNSDTNDTDSAYSTESESNYTAHLPRPSCSPKPTRQHLRPCSNKSQQLINTKCIQGTRPLCIPIPTKSNSKTSHLSTSTHQPEPSTSTWPNTQTTVRQPTLPVPRSSAACTYPQHTRKTPLLPTPPASMRIFNYRNHYNQCISGLSTVNSSRHTYITRPSTFNNRKSTFTRPPELNNNRFHQQHIPRPSPSPPRYSTYPTFSGPATLNNYSYYLQPHIPGPHTTNLPYLHQEFFTGPYQQTPLLPLLTFTGPYQQISGHFTPQVCYLPVILPHPLQHYTVWRKKIEETGYL